MTAHGSGWQLNSWVVQSIVWQQNLSRRGYRAGDDVYGGMMLCAVRVRPIGQYLTTASAGGIERLWATVWLLMSCSGWAGLLVHTTYNSSSSFSHLYHQMTPYSLIRFFCSWKFNKLSLSLSQPLPLLLIILWYQCQSQLMLLPFYIHRRVWVSVCPRNLLLAEVCHVTARIGVCMPAFNSGKRRRYICDHEVLPFIKCLHPLKKNRSFPIYF